MNFFINTRLKYLINQKITNILWNARASIILQYHGDKILHGATVSMLLYIALHLSGSLQKKLLMEIRMMIIY